MFIIQNIHKYVAFGGNKMFSGFLTAINYMVRDCTKIPWIMLDLMLHLVADFTLCMNLNSKFC